MNKSLARFLMILLVLTVFIPANTRHVFANSFQAPVQFENMNAVDSYPTALQASNGTIWVAWESNTTRPNIFFRTTSPDGSTRSTIQNLTGPSTSWNRQPTLAQLQNGTIFFAWTSNLTGHFKLYYKTFTGGVWSSITQLTTGINDDRAPKTAIAQDSTLWIVWERANSTGGTQVFYKTLNGNAWSPDNQLTFDSTFNGLPNVMSARGGSVWVSWSKWFGNTINYNLVYQVFNGTRWSNQTLLTNVSSSSTFGDTHPDLIQDRNGTIWAVWSREMKLTTTVFQDKLFYKFSGNAGQTWSPDTQLTFGGDANNTIDDRQASTIQGIDKFLWIFYSSDATGIGSLFDIYLIKTTNPIYPVHAPAVTKITIQPTKMYPWNVATINVTVADLGDFIENIQLSVQTVNKTSFKVATAQTFLASGQSQTFSFSWNATGAPAGRYAIVASIALVPGETLGAGLGNTLRYRSLAILIKGDLDQDFNVNIIDAAIMAVAYGSTPSSPNWNPNADLDRDGVINIIDFAILGANYGKSI